MSSLFRMLCCCALIMTAGIGLVSAQHRYEVDTSFAARGQAVIEVAGADKSCAVTDIRVLSNDDIEILGVCSQIVYAKLRANGQLEALKILPAVGAHGPIVPSYAKFYAADRAVYAAAGTASWLSGRVFLDGRIDPDYGSQGQVATPMRSPYPGIAGVLAHPDGGMSVYGTDAAGIALARYDPRGKLLVPPTSYGFTDTRYYMPRDIPVSVRYYSATAYQAIVTANKQILVVGSAEHSHVMPERPRGDSDFAVIRFTQDGHLDRGFHRAGRLAEDVAIREKAQAVLGFDDGRFQIAGRAEGGLALARFDAEGNPDRRFGDHGQMLLQSPIAWWNVAALFPVHGGKTLLLGTVKNVQGSDDFGLFSILPNGRADPEFGDKGMLTLHIDDRDNAALAVMQRDGNLLIGSYSDKKLKLTRLRYVPMPR